MLGLYLRNPGRAECAVKNIHVSESAGGAFFMPGGPLVGGVLPYDTSFSTQVAFRPPVAGAYSGELMLTVNEPNAPTVRLPLQGASQDLGVSIEMFGYGQQRALQVRRTLPIHRPHEQQFVGSDVRVRNKFGRIDFLYRA